MTLRANAGKAVRPEHDFYATPAEATWGLLGVEARALYRAKTIWEPACGDGAMVGPLRAAGLRVIASDIVDRGCPESCVQDFMGAQLPLYGSTTAGVIVTNPPYKDAQEWVATALTHAPVVMMLLRLAFLEGGARNAWLRESPLARVYTFASRLPFMHRPGYTGPRLKKSSTAFAWFVWDETSHDTRRIDWITDQEIELGRRLAQGRAAA